jgi:hypothetical protein
MFSLIFANVSHQELYPQLICNDIRAKFISAGLVLDISPFRVVRRALRILIVTNVEYNHQHTDVIFTFTQEYEWRSALFERKRFIVGKHKRPISSWIRSRERSHILQFIHPPVIFFHNISYLCVSAMPKVSTIQMLIYSYVQQLKRKQSLSAPPRHPVPKSRRRKFGRREPPKRLKK